MSRTSNLLITGALACTVAAPAMAQDDILSRMMASDATTPDGSAGAAGGAAGPSEARDELRSAIRRKILEMASRKPGSGIGGNGAGTPDAITIEEIDELNRTAERSRTRLELEKTELERMKTELDSLISIYEAMVLLDEDRDKDRKSRAGASRADAKEKKSDSTPPPPTPQEIEQKKLPRLGALMGVGRSYKAGLVYPDGARGVVEKGDFVEGFEVLAVTGDFMVLKGQMTGTEYRISPRGTPPETDSGSGPQEARPAIDLNQMPLQVF